MFTSSKQRRKTNFFYGGVRTSCKKKPAGRAKFVVFSFTYWVHCRRRHRGLRCCSQDLSTCVNRQEFEHGFSKNACHLFTRYIQSCMLSKTRSITDWFTSFLGKPTFGWRGKKIRCCRKNIYFKETTRVEWIKANCALKTIIFRYFAFFLELTFYFLLYIHYIFFCARLFQVCTCVPCVQVATPLTVLS